MPMLAIPGFLQVPLNLITPPKMAAGWESLRKKMFVKTAQQTSLLLAFLFAILIFLDINMRVDMFVAACGVRYLLVCPALLSFSLLLRFKRSFLFRNFDNVMAVIVVICFLGQCLITLPIYLETIPYGNGEFSPARVAGIWVGLVVLPIHFLHAVWVVFVSFIVFIGTAFICRLIQGYPLEWLAANALALIGVGVAGLFTCYNRDVSEERFFHALASNVRELSLTRSAMPAAGHYQASAERVSSADTSVPVRPISETKTEDSRANTASEAGLISNAFQNAFVGFASLLDENRMKIDSDCDSPKPVDWIEFYSRARSATVLDTITDEKQDGEPEIPDLVLQSMYAALERDAQKEILRQNEQTPVIDTKTKPADADADAEMSREDANELEEKYEAACLEKMVESFQDSIRTRLLFIREFKDSTTEKAFWVEYATNDAKIKSVRFSVFVTTVLLAVLGVNEIYSLSGTGTDAIANQVNLLVMLRYGIMIPVFLLMVLETFAPRRFIRRWHPLILACTLIVSIVFHSYRASIVIGIFGTSMKGVARLQTQRYLTNVLRSLMYVSCGVPMRIPWAFLSSFLGVVAESFIVYGMTDLRVSESWSLTILYPSMCLLMGIWRSLLEDDKARATFILNELTRWKLREDMGIGIGKGKPHGDGDHINMISSRSRSSGVSVGPVSVEIEMHVLDEAAAKAMDVMERATSADDPTTD